MSKSTKCENCARWHRADDCLSSDWHWPTSETAVCRNFASQQGEEEAAWRIIGMVFFLLAGFFGIFWWAT